MIRCLQTAKKMMTKAGCVIGVKILFGVVLPKEEEKQSRIEAISNVYRGGAYIVPSLLKNGGEKKMSNIVRMSKGPAIMGVSKNTFRKMAREANAIISYGDRIKFVDIDEIIKNGKKENHAVRKGAANES